MGYIQRVKINIIRHITRHLKRGPLFVQRIFYKNLKFSSINCETGNRLVQLVGMVKTILIKCVKTKGCKYARVAPQSLLEQEEVIQA